MLEAKPQRVLKTLMAKIGTSLSAADPFSGDPVVTSVNRKCVSSLSLECEQLLPVAY